MLYTKLLPLVFQLKAGHYNFILNSVRPNLAENRVLSWQLATGGQMHILEVGTMESGCYTTGTESLILTLFTAH
jgi:hypothetical protein